jgi:hypothetical protein
MNSDRPPPETVRSAGTHYPLLERITAFVLVLVLAALGWIALAACGLEWNLGLSLDAQVGLVLTLLAVALILVSIVSLLHTRG